MMLSAPCILIVEDEWMIAELLVDTLEDAGYRVSGPAARVNDALALIERDPPMMALLDVNLGIERSYAIAQRLAECNIPFIFMTGYLNSHLPEEFRSRPVITKPVMLEKLVAHIGEVMLHQ